MKILTNRRTKKAIGGSNNQVVFCKIPDRNLQISSFWANYKPSASLKMKSRTQNKDAEQLFQRAPLDGYFTNINTKFSRSFIRPQRIYKFDWEQISFTFSSIPLEVSLSTDGTPSIIKKSHQLCCSASLWEDTITLFCFLIG